MAKEQNLSLNPTKISGVCGRLMCCLKNEQDTYEYLNSRLPSIGDTVTLKDGGRGEVQSVNVLRQLVKVIIDNGDEKELKEVKVDDLHFRPKKRKDVKLTEEELKELKGLEDEGVEGEKETKSDRQDRHDRRDRRDRHEKNDKHNQESIEVVENAEVEEVIEEGTQEKKNFHDKKRFKNRRHFNKNRKNRNNNERNNSSEE
jgi:hypothetical protein